MFAHWFQIEHEEAHRDSALALGLHRREVTCGADVSSPFWVTREELVDESFLHAAQRQLDKIYSDTTVAPSAIDDRAAVQTRYTSPLEIELLQKALTVHRLTTAEPRVEWDKLLRYAEFLRHRTYENEPVTVNLVIDPTKDNGTLDIGVDDSEQKILDPLSASMGVFITVDRAMRILDYSEVDTSSLPADTNWSGCPSFLTPVTRRLPHGHFSFHRTRRGDVVIANRQGLVAAWRKGHWYVYQGDHLTVTLQDLCGFSADQLSETLLSLILDLSYKRHGALLVFDPAGSVAAKVNDSQRIGNPTSDRIRSTFSSAVKLIDLASATPDKRRMKIVSQIASVDGAVIFDNEAIKAFGAYVPQAGETTGKTGTRTLAAYSSRELGGTAIKISADGDVLIPLFVGEGHAKVGAVLRFA